MQAASVALYDTILKLISQTSKLVRSGTSGYDRHVTIPLAYKSSKVISSGKRS